MVARVSRPKSYTLYNPYGWVLTYRPEGEIVTLVRRYKGYEVDDVVISRDMARNHYSAQLRAGFISPETHW